MKKRKVFSVDERDSSKASTHVIIERDTTPPNPLKDYDQVFLLHSNVTREFCGNESDRDYDDPLEEIVDEDGYGTGEYRFREGVVHFPVSAYIHSGVALRMGSIREFPCDPGGWDTTRNAAYLWTDKERFEKMCGPWMEVYDKETKSRRPAKDEAEFRQYLWEIAKDELELFQKYLDGECFWYREETRIPFKRVYPDGREEDDCEWENGDSCGGVYVVSVDDIDFSRDEDTDVFDATGHFVGDDWTIPEFVVFDASAGGYLKKLADDKYAWTGDLDEATVFRYWNGASCAYQSAVPGEYGTSEGYARLRTAIQEKDTLKDKNTPENTNENTKN